MIVDRAFEHVSYAVLRLAETPDLTCSGVSQPDKDLWSHAAGFGVTGHPTR